MANFLLQGQYVGSDVMTDRGSGAHRDLSVSYAVVPSDGTNPWYGVAALAAAGQPDPSTCRQLVVRPHPDLFSGNPIAAYQGDLQYVWGMASGCNCALSVGSAPAGYVALSGFFGYNTGGNGIPGGLGLYACVSTDCVIPMTGGSLVNLWDDSGSGAQDDGMVWGIVDACPWQYDPWYSFFPASNYNQPPDAAGQTYYALNMAVVDIVNS